MANKFNGLGDKDIFSADCKHRFSVPRTEDGKISGKYTATMAGRPDGSKVSQLAAKLADSTVNITTKLPDAGQVTGRATTEKDVNGGKLVDAVLFYGDSAESSGEKPAPKKPRTKKPRVNRVKEVVGANGQS